MFRNQIIVLVYQCHKLLDLDLTMIDWHIVCTI
jgi:hypothetical protein